MRDNLYNEDDPALVTKKNGRTLSLILNHADYLTRCT